MGKARSADGKKLRSLGGAWHNVCLHQGLVSMRRCHQDWNDDRGRYLIVWHHLGTSSKVESWFVADENAD